MTGGWASRHAGALVAVAAALALVVAGSIVRCSAVHAPTEVERSPEALADAELTDSMRALRRSYTDTTLEALGLLAANTWIDDAGTTVVGVTDRAIETRTQGDDSWEGYVVAASARTSRTEDGVTSTVTTLCLQTPEWCELATVTLPSASSTTGRAADPATFQCPAVAGGAELTLSPALKEVEVDGPPDSLLRARGTDLEAVRAALASWCGTWQPTATSAEWGKVVEEDHEERVCKVYYRLDDQRGTQVTLSISMDDGGLAVEEGGR